MRAPGSRRGCLKGGLSPGLCPGRFIIGGGFCLDSFEHGGEPFRVSEKVGGRAALSLTAGVNEVKNAISNLYRSFKQHKYRNHNQQILKACDRLVTNH
jgi:hypothetical protein